MNFNYFVQYQRNSLMFFTKHYQNVTILSNQADTSHRDISPTATAVCQPSQRIFREQKSSKNQLIQLANQRNVLMNRFLKIVKNNNAFIENLNNKLTQNYNAVNQLIEHVSSVHPKSHECGPFKPNNSSSKMTDNQSSQTEHQSQKKDSTLTQRIFGKKNYNYRLQLAEEIPSILYKEKNFNVKVHLMNQENQKTINGNAINLCIAVCDKNGEWITENRAKQNIFKGVTESSLYHGEGQFLKIYSRQVSRKLPEGQMNIVVYPKPSLLQYHPNTAYLEQNVNWEEVEPLILRNVCVLSKKF